MNIHHLELFYHVTKHGGISQAVRRMPYGIQQPAVSSQVIQLEEGLGVTLFQRRPFALTPAGRELYEFIRPFFDGLDAMANRLRGGGASQIRIGASEVVLRDYLPGILSSMKAAFPGLKLILRQGYQPELEALVQHQELDLAITLLEGKPPAGTRSKPLLRLPLILLAPADSPIQSAEELWKKDRIPEALVSLPPNEGLCRSFQKGLARLGVDWFTSVEVSTLDLVESYVASGYGIGLSLAPPRAATRSKLKVLPLAGFEPVHMGVLWQGRPSPMLRTLMAAIESAAARLAAAAAGPVRPAS